MAEIYNRTLVDTKAAYVIDSTVGQSFGEEHLVVTQEADGSNPLARPLFHLSNQRVRQLVPLRRNSAIGYNGYNILVLPGIAPIFFQRIKPGRVHKRTWDAETMDLPIVNHSEQKRPSLKAKTISKLITESTGQEQARFAAISNVGGSSRRLKLSSGYLLA